MKCSASLAAVLSALLTLSSGCADPTEPEWRLWDTEWPTVAPPATAPQPDVRTFPALSRPGEIYDEAHISYLYARAWVTRYVLYQDGTFGLQTISPRGFYEYTGAYSRAESLIKFWFNKASSSTQWDATGTLSGESLSIKFINEYMIHSDFLDGVYVQSQGAR